MINTTAPFSALCPWPCCQFEADYNSSSDGVAMRGLNKRTGHRTLSHKGLNAFNTNLFTRQPNAPSLGSFSSWWRYLLLSDTRAHKTFYHLAQQNRVQKKGKRWREPKRITKKGEN